MRPPNKCKKPQTYLQSSSEEGSLFTSSSDLSDEDLGAIMQYETDWILAKLIQVIQKICPNIVFYHSKYMKLDKKQYLLQKYKYSL